MFIRELQFFAGPATQPTFVVERKEGVPYVIQHLVLVFSCSKQVKAANLRNPVVSEDRLQRCRDGASRYGGRAGEIETIRSFCTLLFAGIFPFAGDSAGDLFEIEIRLAFPEEERTNRLELFLCQRSWSIVARSCNPDVVDERQHPELLKTGMRNGAPTLRRLEGASAD